MTTEELSAILARHQQLEDLAEREDGAYIADVGALLAEVQRLRALLYEQNTTIAQTLAAAMGCYPHAPDETGAEDPSAPYVVEPAIAEDVAYHAAEMIRELRLTLAAEQGRQEGAPSERWRFTAPGGYGMWTAGIEATGGYHRVARSHAVGGETAGWWLTTYDGLGVEVSVQFFATARAAMQAADKASP